MAPKRSAAEAAAPVVEEEAAFPRGGGSTLSALEAKQLRAEGAAQARADAAAGGSRKKQKKLDDSGGAGFLGTAAAAAASSGGKLPKFVELLKFKNLAVGMRVWGSVLEASQRGLTVGLPHGLRGRVSPAEASDVLAGMLKKAGLADGMLPKGAAWPAGVPQLPELFTVGQLVRCTIMSLQQGDKSKRVVLSLHVARLNGPAGADGLHAGAVVPAAVKAVEDHGYSLTFGIKGVSGFLKKADAEGAPSAGALLDVAVQSAADKRLVTVTAAREAVASGVLKDDAATDLGSLLPGALVNVRVKAVLSDGLLVSFLTYFSGTVDPFHLGQELKSFEVGQRLRARILAVDPAAKTVALSLLRHLVACSSDCQLPAVGTVFEGAVVQRVDPGLGVVFRLPSNATTHAAAGFAHVSALRDSRIDKIEKAFKPGQTVKVKVVGARPMDGLAVLSAKPSVVEAAAAPAAALAAGQVVAGRVASIDDKGAVLTLSPGIRAFVPLVHLSDAGGRKGKAKWAVGQEVTARVLETDAASKRTTATLKKTLVNSKLPLIVHLQDAIPGTRTHGTVTGATPTGVFVSFFNGIRGLVHASALGLTEDQTPEDAFKVGQVLKVRVVSVDAAKRRLTLGLATTAAPVPGAKPAAAGAAEAANGGDALAALRPGDVVDSSTITAVHGEGAGLYYEVELPGGVRGRLDAPHLADHPAAVEALREAIGTNAGAALGPLLVLERLERIKMVRVSRKASLVAAASAGALPSELEDVREAALLPGYIASLTADAAYVRFGGGLTGRAGLPQLADSFVSDPARHFAIGQSVRAQIVQVDQERRRFSVTLKPALVASPDAALLASLFADLELAARLRSAASPEEAATPWDAFAIGGLAAGAVHAHEDFGVTVDLEADENVVGLISPGQEGESKPAVGAALSARVLDVSKADGVVDLSVAPALLPTASQNGKASKKEPKAEKLKVSADKLEVTMQLVKPDYLVVSLPRRKPAVAPTLGFLSTKDYNLLVSAADDAPRRFSIGQKLLATITQLPSAETGGRLLMHMAVQSEAAAAAANAAAEKRVASKAAPGRVMNGTVTHSSPLVADVKLESGERARLHVTEWRDPDTNAGASGPEQSFVEAYPEHGPVRAVVMGTVPTPAGRRHGVLELSARPAAIAAANDKGAAISPAADLATLRVGQAVQGYVQEVADAHVWVALSPTLRGRLHASDAAGEPDELADLAKRFAVGQPLRCRVLQVDRATHSVDLSQQDVDSGRPGGGKPPPPGSLVTGRVVATGGFGLRLRLAGGFAGAVGLCDIHDTYVANALAGISAGTMVRGCVLPAQEAGDGAAAANGGASGVKAAVRLSLRASDGGAVAGRRDVPGAAAGSTSSGVTGTPKQPDVGDKVHGYVSGVGKAGAFITLRNGATAHVKLAHLADGYVEEPAKEFPIGRHVRGRVTAKEGSRIEMSLRTKEAAAPSAALSLAEIAVDSVVEGRVRRVEDFGVFVEVGGRGGPCGLAHISEVSDGFAADIHSQFHAGQEVRAKVLRVDAVAGKLSLSLRPSAVDGAAASPDAEDMATGAASDEEADLDEEMAARLDDAEGVPEPMEGIEEGSASDEEINGMHAAAEVEEASTEASDEDEDEADLDSELEAAVVGTEPLTSPKMVVAAAPVKTLDLGADAGWGDDEAAAAVADTSDDDSDAGGEAAGGKLSKAQKKRAKADKEAAIRRAELARADPGAEPDTVDAFERLVVSQPDSSHAWIRYMAFLLTLGDADGARAVAERALNTINYREEDEKFNVWAALLNLENTYGSPPEEAAMAAFRRAASHTDPKKLHLAAAAMFGRTGRVEAARTLLKAACRNFGGSAKVWLQALSLELGEGGGGSAAAQKVLDRALNALPSRKHIKVITQAALAEFRAGTPERGRSLFEGVLRNYPRRLDLWSVYLDQEIKAGDAARTRALFERAITLQLPPRKMKFFFKRYLAYEQQHGDAARVEHVKTAAREYVDNAAPQ